MRSVDDRDEHRAKAAYPCDHDRATDTPLCARADIGDRPLTFVADGLDGNIFPTVPVANAADPQPVKGRNCHDFARPYPAPATLVAVLHEARVFTRG